jgi:hypothetical protein
MTTLNKTDSGAGLTEKTYSMVFERPINSITGTLYFYENGKLFLKTRALSGQSGHQTTSWVRGKSPIPSFNNGFLWCDYCLQNGELNPTGSQIGEFWNISTGDKDRTLIQGAKLELRRLSIGLHNDNDYAGSAGCVVLPKTEAGRAAYRTIRTVLLSLQKKGVKRIPFTSKVIV